MSIVLCLYFKLNETEKLLIYNYLGGSQNNEKESFCSLENENKAKFIIFNFKSHRILTFMITFRQVKQ